MIIVFIIIACLFLAQYFAYEELEQRVKSLETQVIVLSMKGKKKHLVYVSTTTEVKGKKGKK